ncbi:MAG TPA: hypothetical protein VHX38_21805 [Pseudonocardiaceae bacterium]|nr:hypothetical protein [Pseudonocardiaceae bacterium]
MRPVVFSHPDHDDPVGEDQFAPAPDADAEGYRDAVFLAPAGLSTVEEADLPPTTSARRPARRTGSGQAGGQAGGRRYVRRTH